MKPSRLAVYASFVKIEHTLFSLPLIFAGMLLGVRDLPSLRQAALIILAAVGARTMAMGLNRIIDAEIDARNLRTRARELPSGAMKKKEAWAITLLSALVYFGSASAIAPICLYLSPIPVALFVFYPYLKRFTNLAHLGLGLAWSMGPLAGWLAATRSLSGFGEVFWLWLFSVLWVTGFDIIYATLDEVFDRAEGLHSLPSRLGKKKSLRVALLLHFASFMALTVLWHTQLGRHSALPWLAVIGGLFIWQHAIAKRNPAFAFFQLNGVLGFLVLGFIWFAIR